MLRSNSPGIDKFIKRAPCRRYSVAGGICVLQKWFPSLPCAAFQTIKSFCVCEVIFPLGDGSAGQGGRGDSDLPPMPPWTPYTPFKRPRDTPGPPLPRKGYFLLFLDRQGPYRARHLFGLGPATNRMPRWARTLHGPGAEAILPQGGTAVTGPCLHAKDRPAPRSRGRDQLRRRRQWPSQGRT